MADNPIRGTVGIEIGGAIHELRFNWDRLARLQAEFGAGREYLNALDEILKGMDFEKIARVLQIGIGGGLTVQAITEGSPPIMAATAAIQKALLYALYGPDHKARSDDNGSTPEPAGEAEAEKKIGSPAV